MLESSIESILDDVFFDGTEEAINTLKKYELFDIVQEQINYFNKTIEDKKATRLNVAYASFTKEINTKLYSIEDSDTRENLKYLLSEIGNFLIDELIAKKFVSRDDLVNLEEFLKDAYELLGYNFQDLKKRTQFLRIASILERQTPEVTVFYDWIKHEMLLTEIALNLKSQNMITSVKDFKKLFTPNPVQVNINSESSDFIVVLFDILYQKKIIKPRGKKGHFSPLKSYSIDFENNILFKKEMKHVKDSIKKNHSKYEKLRVKAQKWIYVD